MDRQDKQLLIESLENDFKESKSSFIVGVTGLTVENIQGLRKTLSRQGGKLKVAKNTLLKIATDKNPDFSGLTPYFKNQIAIVFAKKDPSEIAKIIFEASKTNEKLVLIAGEIEGKVINKGQVEQLATLPPKEVLLAQLCGTLNAPMIKLVSTLNQFMLKLVWVLKKIEEEKQKQS